MDKENHKICSDLRLIKSCKNKLNKTFESKIKEKNNLQSEFRVSLNP